MYSIFWSNFNHQNVGIKFSPWNKKLFNIELAIFLNHSILILGSKVIIEILELRNYTKYYKKKLQIHVEEKSLVTPFFAYIKSLRPPFVSIPSKGVLIQTLRTSFGRWTDTLSDFHCFLGFFWIWIFIQKIMWYISIF